MDLELVTIGTELLLGFTVDTNSAFLGHALAAVGVRITRRTSVPDDGDAVAAAVREALARSRLVITTGGLGPTRDDVTKHAVAGLFGLELDFRQDIWDELAARWARMGRKIGDRNRGQAEVPRGALVLSNRWGTAPGLWISGEPGEVIMLPGVPPEMRGLVTHEVVPRLAARGGTRVIRSRMVRTTGIPESTLADRISDLEDALPPLTLAYLPGLEGVDLRLTAWHSDPGAADTALESAAAVLTERLGDHAYGGENADLAAVLLDACKASGHTISLAESCTGGLVGVRITAIPGSSAVFAGGMICYDDALKQELGVPARILEEQGAVSEGTVRAMAEAARSRYGTSLAAAISGIAGPGGGSDDKPVGTVWFAFADRQGVESVRYIFPGSRADVRARAAQFALLGLLRRARRAAGSPEPSAISLQSTEG
jgi:nicotinamide-nucleotide amidase